MSNPKNLKGFEKHITGDGSPTLSIAGGEKMHSLDGAFSESLYIYAPCIEATRLADSPHVLSMGLGLGYNELISAALFIKNDIKSFRICSFESYRPLRESFQKWLLNQDSCLAEVFGEVAGRIEKHYEINQNSLQSFLLQARSDEQFFIEDSIPAKNPWPWTFNALLYDAFSGDTDKGLWTEDHLRNFLQEYSSAKSCFFATYAATGNLKRSLVAENFTIEKKGGFGKKRESTFAFRT